MHELPPDALTPQLPPPNPCVAMALRDARRHILRGTDGLPLIVHVLEFDIGRFVPGAFEASGIDCPPIVARSVHKRQAEFFFGRLAARHALSALGIAPVEIPIGPSREPQWPRNVIGSISHSQCLAAACAELHGHRRGMGIDIERVVAAEARDALLGTIVGPDEIAYLHELTDDAWSLEALLTIVFSAKESLFKGLFDTVGRYFDFSAARIVALDPEHGNVRFVLTETLCTDLAQGQHYDVGFDFIRVDTVLAHFVW